MTNKTETETKLKSSKFALPDELSTPLMCINDLYLVVYGRNGQGKTPLAGFIRDRDNPDRKPLIIDIEHGAAGVDNCYKMPSGNERIASFTDFVECVNALVIAHNTSKSRLDKYAVIVLDGFSTLIELADRHICAMHNVNTLFEVGGNNIDGYTQRNALIIKEMLRLEGIGKGIVITTQEDYREATKTKPASCKPRLGSDSLETKILNKANLIVRIDQRESTIIDKQTKISITTTDTWARVRSNDTIVARARWTGKDWLKDYIVNGSLRVKNYENSFNAILNGWLDEVNKTKQLQTSQTDTMDKEE